MDDSKFLKEALKNDLATFVKKGFKVLDPKTKLIWNWHLDLICEYLQAVYNGEIKRLIINVPPRSLKSIMVNVCYPAWALVNNPSYKTISASFRSSLSVKHNIGTRSIITSLWFQKFFPEVELSESQNSKSLFETTAKGGKECSTMKSPPTGSGANCIIIDDPHNTSEAESETERTKICESFGSSFMTRLNNQKEDSVIVVMQRLHDLDLTGYLLSKEKKSKDDILDSENWVHLKIPAIAEEDIIYHYPNSQEIFKIFKKGEFLCEERLSKRVLDNIKKDMGSYSFEGQYQQNPSPPGGGMVKSNWWMRYKLPPERTGCEVYISLDAAGKKGIGNDPSVFTIWYKKGDLEHYLIEVIREKLEFPELKKKAKLLLQKWNPNAFLIEDASSGQALIQDLKTETAYNIVGITDSLQFSKSVRLESCVSMIEGGFVFIPAVIDAFGIPVDWVEEYTQELERFPRAPNDDQVDSTTLYLNYIRNKRAVWEII